MKRRNVLIGRFLRSLSRRPGWLRDIIFGLAAALLLAPLSGCLGSGKPQKDPPEKLDARAVFDHLLKTYRYATTYRDQGTIRIRFWQDGRLQENSAPMSVAFRRPNMFAANLYQVQMACDGSNFKARIIDQQTSDMDGQVVVRQAPKQLSLEEVYRDKLMASLIEGGMGRFPVQIELLLSSNPLSALAASESQMRLLEEDTIGRNACYRLEVKPSDDSQGVYILWIDRESYLLRRFEYPNDFIPALAQSTDITDLKLVADFEQASFDESESANDSFQLDVPKGASLVKNFITPPQPLPYSQFGKRPDDFFFTKLQGGQATQDAIQGRTTVLLWFNNHPLGKISLQQLEAVREKYQDNDKIAFYAVCTEPSSLTDDQLKDLAKQWDIKMEVVRDLKPFGSTHFKIDALPTLMMLDERGVIQLFEVLDDPQLTEGLPQVIDRLLSGENLAAKILEDYQSELDKYARLLTAAGDEKSVTVFEKIPELKIAEPTPPKNLKLTQLWHCEELKAAGNISVVESSDGKQTILVHDGQRSIVELDEQGKITQRHELDLPEGAVVSYLRNTVDGQGHRFYVVGQSMGRQIHLFDAGWKRLLSYPDAEQPHPGIRDVQIVDLDGDKEGTPELYVGFGGLVGIQRVSLSGKREWSNRDVPTVLSLALSTKDNSGRQTLLAVGDLGRITSLDNLGKAEQPMVVKNRTIIQLVATNIEGPQSEPYCAVALAEEGKLLAIGLSENKEEMWAFELPQGGHDSPIEFIASSQLFENSPMQWLIAGSDGSIQITGQSDDDSDYYRYGQSLKGMATTHLGTDRVLLVSTAKGVTAWKVEEAKMVEKP